MSHTLAASYGQAAQQRQTKRRLHDVIDLNVLIGAMNEERVKQRDQSLAISAAVDSVVDALKAAAAFVALLFVAFCCVISIYELSLSVVR